MWKWIEKLTGSRPRLDTISSLAQSEFDGVERLVGVALPQHLKNLYRQRWESLSGGKAYLDLLGFRHAKDRKVMRFVAINPRNHCYGHHFLPKHDRTSVLIAHDDFGNLYFLQAPNWSVHFLSLDDDKPELFLIYATLDDFIAGVQWPKRSP